MTVNRADRYPGRWGTETADYPLGVPKNRTSETSQDGSYFEKDWISDYEAFFGALMTDAGLTPNGTADTAIASQLINALRKTSYVENRFKGNQNWNVAGADGEVTDTEQTFSTVDAEFSAGRYVATSLVDAKYDNGLFSATSGSYYVEYDGDFTDNFYGVKLDDDSITQDGCTLSLVSGKTRLTVDVGVVGAHKFPVLSELEGNCQDISDDESRSGMILERINSRTIQDFTSSKSTGVTYKNNTGTDINIYISAISNTNGSDLSILVDSVIVAQLVGGTTTSTYVAASGVTIPEGSEYLVSSALSNVIKWFELRF